MIRALRLLCNLQGLLVERLGVAVLALFVVKQGQIVHAGGQSKIVRTEG